MADSKSELPFDGVRRRFMEAADKASGDDRLSAEIQLELASFLFRRGRFSDASNVADALRTQPGRLGFQARYVAAFGRLWREDYSALKELRKIWEDDLDGPVGLNAGAVYHSYNGKNARGEELARESIGKDAQYVDPYISLAFCLNDQNKRAEALKPLERAQLLQPDHPRLYMAKAFATGGLGRNTASYRAYDRVISLTMPTPMRRALRTRIRISQSRQDFPAIRRDADLILRQVPKDLEALFWRGFAHERSGNRTSARIDWRAASQAHPEGFQRLLKGAGPYAQRVREVLGQ